MTTQHNMRHRKTKVQNCRSLHFVIYINLDLLDMWNGHNELPNIHVPNGSRKAQATRPAPERTDLNSPTLMQKCIKQLIEDKQVTDSLELNRFTSWPPKRFRRPTSPPLAVTRSRSSAFSSRRWSTVSSCNSPPCVSRMQRESPTDATVTVNPSMTTSVAVVPDTSPERGSGVELQARLQNVPYVIGVAVAVVLTLALEIDVGLDKAGDERAGQRLKPVVAADVRRQRAHDVLEQMLLAVDRRRHAVVAVEHLARQIQAAEGRQMVEPVVRTRCSATLSRPQPTGARYCSQLLAPAPPLPSPGGGPSLRPPPARGSRLPEVPAVRDAEALRAGWIYFCSQLLSAAAGFAVRSSPSSPSGPPPRSPPGARPPSPAGGGAAL